MHPWLGEWVRLLVLLHVMGAFAFVLLHGPSVAALLMLRAERDVGRVQALLTLSGRASALSWIGWVWLGLTGLALAAGMHTWRAPWVWGSALVLIGVTLSMSPMAARAFNEARHAAGLPYFDGKGVAPPGPVDPRALEKALDVIRARSIPITLIGSVGLALLVWLMVWRPS